MSLKGTRITIEFGFYILIQMQNIAVSYHKKAKYV